MGQKLIDQYSYLHLASGVIAYFWGVSLNHWFWLHLAFELLENTKMGMGVINTVFDGLWPGGKPYADFWINMLGDQIFALIGWISAYYLDKWGLEYGWYEPHLAGNTK